MSYTQMGQLGNRYQGWMKALQFYTEDIDILEGRLAEVGMKNTKAEADAGVEKFQDLFVNAQQRIYKLKNQINQFAHDLKVEAEKHAGHVDSTHFTEQKDLQSAIDGFETEMAAIRKDFNAFLAKWM
jgi:F0F1-type ATP synthase membrane subunit b/b'